MPIYNRFEMERVINEYVVNPKYREVLYLKYVEGLTHEQVAEKSNYCTQQVKNICRDYKNFLISLL